jgi:hypothetical protein
MIAAYQGLILGGFFVDSTDFNQPLSFTKQRE